MYRLFCRALALVALVLQTGCATDPAIRSATTSPSPPTSGSVLGQPGSVETIFAESAGNTPVALVRTGTHVSVLGPPEGDRLPVALGRVIQVRGWLAIASLATAPGETPSPVPSAEAGAEVLGPRLFQGERLSPLPEGLELFSNGRAVARVTDTAYGALRQCSPNGQYVLASGDYGIAVVGTLRSSLESQPFNWSPILACFDLRESILLLGQRCRSAGHMWVRREPGGAEAMDGDAHDLYECDGSYTEPGTYQTMNMPEPSTFMVASNNAGIVSGAALLWTDLPRNRADNLLESLMRSLQYFTNVGDIVAHDEGWYSWEVDVGSLRWNGRSFLQCERDNCSLVLALGNMPIRQSLRVL